MKPATTMHTFVGTGLPLVEGRICKGEIATRYQAGGLRLMHFVTRPKWSIPPFRESSTGEVV